jgi:hypothetical protein
MSVVASVDAAAHRKVVGFAEVLLAAASAVAGDLAEAPPEVDSAVDLRAADSVVPPVAVEAAVQVEEDLIHRRFSVD